MIKGKERVKYMSEITDQMQLIFKLIILEYKLHLISYMEFQTDNIKCNLCIHVYVASNFLFVYNNVVMEYTK